MRFVSIVLISISLCVFSGCKKDETQGRNFAKYKVTFSMNWNSQDFPVDYPSNPHFSSLLGWSHQINDSLFRVGTYATQGIKDLAERGKTTPLDAEINERIANKQGYKLFIGSSLGNGTGEIEIEVEVSRDYPCVTLATMIAPSPDWYVAIINVNLFEKGYFIEKKSVAAHVYDSGTDDGLTFTSPDSVSTPPQPITAFVGPPLGNGIAVSPDIATVKFEKI